VPTIGVAIAIPEPWADDLQQQRKSFGDSQAGAIPTHITLVPPTPVNEDLTDVQRHLDAVAAHHQPFRLRLRGTATFRPLSPVVFIVVSEGISACELLAESARNGPLRQQLTFPYHPHVTVAHDLDDASLDHAYDALAGFDCTFPVSDFHLYAHGDDGVWRPFRTFALGDNG
jgi:2'-5' RNA ligase